MGRVGFVGLGVMGGPMAGHLVQAGHAVTVWNRTASKGEPLAEAGAKVARTLEELAEECEVIFTCVARTEDVEEVVGAMAKRSQRNAIFVDHSTISPSGAVAIKEDIGRFVDAPITGGSMGAQKGTLTIFCGGDAEDIETARPYMEAYGKRIERVGPSGAGQMMKLANQIAVGGALQALCEALAFAQKAGLDLGQTRELLSTGAAGSWAFDNYGPKILARDWSPGFSVVNQRKDFAYCMETASEIGAPIPCVQLTDHLLAKLQEAGHGDWTTAALFEVLTGGVA